MNLKFRAWHKELKEMSISFSLFDLTDAYDEGHYCWNRLMLGQYPSTSQEKLEIMQWTGLKDKNKKDIYEGDIIKLGNIDIFFVENFHGQFVLRWDQDMGQGMKAIHRDKTLHDFCQNDFEVIGDIYQNNNLLLEEK